CLLPSRGGRQLAFRVGVAVEHCAHFHGISSATSSASVTGFTGLGWSGVEAADDADGAIVVGEVAVAAGAAGPGTGAAVVAGPGSCGLGDCGMNCESFIPPGARQSRICKCGRVCIPNFADFHGRLSRCTIGNTCSPRSMRVTAICSSKAL